MNTRRQQAQYIRNNAAELAANRPHPQHINNKEEYEYRRPKKMATSLATLLISPRGCLTTNIQAYYSIPPTMTSSS